MKKTICDSCRSENARSYFYIKLDEYHFKDFCVNCLQEFVLKNQVKLAEVEGNNKGKRVIHG